MRSSAWPRWALCALLLSGCTSIEIGEQDAFDAKRTVSARLLERLDVTRKEGRLPVAEDVELSTWHLRQREGARGVLLYFGGNGYLMIESHHILQGILRSPVDVFTHDYRGFGESDGEPGVEAMKADALAVYDHVRGTLGVPPERIVVHGQSLGTFVALWVAARRPVAGVVLETPVTTVEDLLGHLAPWWTRAFISFQVDPALTGESNLERIRDLSAPLLVLAGAEDAIAHPDMARALFEAAPVEDKRLEIFPEGSHNDLPPRTDYQAAHRAFVRDVLPPSPAPSRADASR
jgi:pimeloyl-ACP methyl ester carboxylesterase